MLCGLSIHGTFLVNVLCMLAKTECVFFICRMQFSLSIYPLGRAYELCCLHLLYSNFCLLELSATERGVLKLKSPTMTMDLMTCNFFFFIYFRAISLRDSGLLYLPAELLLLCNNPLYSRHTFWLKICFV